MEEHHEKHNKHIAKKRLYRKDKSGTWKTASLVLFILLLISIFTEGFSGSSVVNIRKDVNNLALKYNNEKLFELVETINTNLDEMDEVISNIDPSVTTTTQPVAFQGEKVVVEFYVMSQCPYGTQVEDAIAPVLEDLAGAVDFRLDFIASDNGDGTFRSLHGQPEVEGNIVQLCAIKHEPDMYMDMVVCMNKDAGKIPGNWEDCASDNGLNVEAIKACFEGEEGKELLRESLAKAQARQASGSPTIFINDERYSGARDSTSFKKAICNYIDHPECDGLPECTTAADCPKQEGKIPSCENPGQANAECVYTDAVAFEVVILNDETCSACDTARMELANENYFPGVTHRTVDASSDEGKELIEKYDIMYAPTFLFGKDVTKTATYTANPQFAAFFEDVGEYMKLSDSSTGATHFVNEEAREEFEAKFGIDPEDGRPQVDFFVMSYCPYGNQAEEGLEPVYQLFGDSVIFNPRYVVYSNYQGGGPNFCLDEENVYCSMHGIVELNQDIREACVNKYYGVGKWFEFALAMNSECNSNNADECWVDVASNIGIDTDQISQCEADEAVDMLSPDKELGDSVGVSGSPTVFINAKSYSGGRAPENFKAAICAEFDEPPAECDTVLGEEQDQASGSC